MIEIESQFIARPHHHGTRLDALLERYIESTGSEYLSLF